MEAPETKSPANSRPAEDSIMNRKREHRGLSASFSSNIGRPRSSPPRREQAENKSVKSIIAWVEAGKTKQGFPTTCTSQDSPNKTASSERSLQTRTTKDPRKSVDGSSTETAVDAQQPSLTTAPDVEECSLTLLKYRQYYTATPLGRCLDVLPIPSEEDEGIVASSLPFSVAQAEIPFAGDVSSNRTNASDCSKLDKHTIGSQMQPRSYERDLTQVNAFWSSVRNYLRSSDEDLEGAQNTSTSHGVTFPTHGPCTAYAAFDQRSGLYTPPTASSAAPSHLGSSTPFTVTSGKYRPREKKRFPSTEEKLFEIDAFLCEEDPAQLTFSPTLVTPVGRIFESGDEYFPRTNTRGSRMRTDPDGSGVKKQAWALRLDLPEAAPRPRNRLRPMWLAVKVPPVMTAEDEEYNFF